MFIVEVNKNSIQLIKTELLTSGSSNVNKIKFNFNSCWDSMAKTATFKAGDEQKPVILDETNICAIPEEILRKGNQTLYVGVYGSKENKIILPTVWCKLGQIKDGVSIDETEFEENESLYNQIIDKISAIEASVPEAMTADELREILTSASKHQDETKEG